MRKKFFLRNKFVYFEKQHYVKGIKSRFTQVWGIFLDYEIDYVVQRSNLLNNDVIMFHIFGSLVYNQNLFMKKNEYLSFI